MGVFVLFRRHAIKRKSCCAHSALADRGKVCSLAFVCPVSSVFFDCGESESAVASLVSPNAIEGENVRYGTQARF